MPLNPNTIGNVYLIQLIHNLLLFEEKFVLVPVLQSKENCKSPVIYRVVNTMNLYYSDVPACGREGREDGPTEHKPGARSG